MKRTHQELWVTVFLSLLSVSAGTVVDETAPKFRAAVYEHVVTMPSDPKENVTRAEALSIMRQNLATYAQQAQSARAQVRKNPREAARSFRPRLSLNFRLIQLPY